VLLEGSYPNLARQFPDAENLELEIGMAVALLLGPIYSLFMD
jgi:hypothetical protein